MFVVANGDDDRHKRGKSSCVHPRARKFVTALLFQVVRQLSLKHSFCTRFFQLAEQAGIGEHGSREARVYAFKQFVGCAALAGGGC
jgi:hypothetical protein